MVMTLCGRSIHRAIATAAGVGTLIAAPTTIGFIIIGFDTAAQGVLPWGSLGYVNIPATIAITSTSMIAAPWGAAAAHSLPPDNLKRIFGVYLVVIALLMFRSAMRI